MRNRFELTFVRVSEALGAKHRCSIIPSLITSSRARRGISSKIAHIKIVPPYGDPSLSFGMTQMGVFERKYS